MRIHNFLGTNSATACLKAIKINDANSLWDAFNVIIELIYGRHLLWIYWIIDGWRHKVSCLPSIFANVYNGMP